MCRSLSLGNSYSSLLWQFEWGSSRKIGAFLQCIFFLFSLLLSLVVQQQKIAKYKTKVWDQENGPEELQSQSHFSTRL